MSKYFPKPFRSFGKNLKLKLKLIKVKKKLKLRKVKVKKKVKVKVDLSNFAKKANIENISHVDTSSFALKTSLANLKTDVDKLDLGKLVSVPVS